MRQKEGPARSKGGIERSQATICICVFRGERSEDGVARREGRDCFGKGTKWRSATPGQDVDAVEVGMPYWLSQPCIRESFFQLLIRPLVQRLTMAKHAPLKGIGCYPQNCLPR